MKDLFFYDAGCRIGTDICSPGKTPEDLLAHMDYSGVDKALVVHTGAQADVINSNKRIAEMVATAPDRLTGTWCFLPDQCPEHPNPDRFFDDMRENNIRALVFFPGAHRYVPSPLTIGKIMGEAAERKIPIFLDEYTGNGNTWNELYNFLEKFPTNTFIFRAATGKWGHDRQVRPLLEHYPNFYFGLGGYWVPEGIYELAKLYGAERLLFASNYPKYSMGTQMLQLKHSRLSDDEIALIAGKNLDRLLKGAQL